MARPRRNPFEGVTDYVSELSRLRSLGVYGGGGGHSESETLERTHASAWIPVTDILARGDDLVIRIELPGVDPADVDLTYRQGILTVSGTRAGDPGEDGEFYVRERFHGEFRRLITLPESVEARHITAAFDDGLVEITVSNAVPAPEGTRIELTDQSDPPTSRTIDVSQP